MSKTISTITLDVEVKDKAILILKSRGENLSNTINDFLKEIIEKEERK